MALVKVSEVLKMADAANTSAIAFNCVDFNTVHSVITVAEELQKPVIVMLYPGHCIDNNWTTPAAFAPMVAAEAAKGLKPTLLRTAGSDAHTPREVGRAWVCVEADALSLPALRAALANPLDFSCGKCPHMSIARSQLTHIYKDRKGPAAYAKWLVLVAVCALRALKGVFL